MWQCHFQIVQHHFLALVLSIFTSDICPSKPQNFNAFNSVYVLCTEVYNPTIECLLVHPLTTGPLQTVLRVVFCRSRDLPNFTRTSELNSIHISCFLSPHLDCCSTPLYTGAHIAIDIPDFQLCSIPVKLVASSGSNLSELWMPIYLLPRNVHGISKANYEILDRTQLRNQVICKLVEADWMTRVLLTAIVQTTHLRIHPRILQLDMIDTCSMMKEITFTFFLDNLCHPMQMMVLNQWQVLVLQLLNIDFNNWLQHLEFHCEGTGFWMTQTMEGWWIFILQLERLWIQQRCQSRSVQGCQWIRMETRLWAL